MIKLSQQKTDVQHYNMTKCHLSMMFKLVKKFLNFYYMNTHLESNQYSLLLLYQNKK